MKKYFVVLGTTLAVVVAVTIWWIHSRENNSVVRSADTVVSQDATDRKPAAQQASSPIVQSPATPHRTVMTSTHTVPNSPTASLTQNGKALAAASDVVNLPRTDAEVLNRVVSPTGDPEDEFNHVKVMHNRLVTEPRDDTWASQAEAQLRNYLTAAMGPERVTLVAVQCASTVCEIQAATRVPGNVSADLEDWQKIIFAMVQQSWWADYQFSQPSNMVRDAPDKQRALFVAYITRLPAAG